MRRIRDEIKIANELIKIGLLTTKYYARNDEPIVLFNHLRSELNKQYGEAKTYLDAKRKFERARTNAARVAPLEANLQQLETALEATIGEGGIIDDDENARLKRKIVHVQAKLKSAKETQGNDIGALETAAKAAVRALDAKVATEKTTRNILLTKYREARGLFNNFRAAQNAAALFNIPAPEVQIEQSGPRRGDVVQTAGQQQRLMQMQMPARIREGDDAIRAEWMRQQRGLIAQGVQLEGMNLKLDQILRMQGNQATLEGQGQLLLGQEQAHEHRDDIAVAQAEQMEEVQNKLDAIAADMGRYQRNVQQQIQDCYPLTCDNIIPCVFKFLIIIVKFIIYMHKVVYQSTRVAGKVANVSLQGIPYVGIPLGNLAESVICIGMLMLYLSLWTVLFSAIGQTWDGQEIFVFVCSSVCEIIKRIIVFFWDQISAIPRAMGSFVYRAVQPLIDGAGTFLRGLWTAFCTQLPAPMRWIFGCGSFSFSGGGTEGEKMTNDEFFAQMAASIPEELKEECDIITTYLSNYNPDILSLQRVACNIINKMEMDARSGNSEYFKKIQAKLKEKGYGPKGKSLPISEIVQGFMKGSENIFESKDGYIQTELPKLITLGEEVSIKLQGADQKSTIEEIKSYISQIQPTFVPSDTMPFPMSNSLLENLTGLVNMWNTNFLFNPEVSEKEQIELINERGGIPFGISDKSAAVLQKKIAMVGRDDTMELNDDINDINEGLIDDKLTRRDEYWSDELGKTNCAYKQIHSAIQNRRNSRDYKRKQEPQQGITATQLREIPLQTGVPPGQKAIEQTSGVPLAVKGGGRKKRTKKRRRKRRRYSRKKKRHKTMKRKRTKRRKYKKRRSRRKRSKRRRSR
jgi:hypothetical protein